MTGLPLSQPGAAGLPSLPRLRLRLPRPGHKTAGDGEKLPPIRRRRSAPLPPESVARRPGAAAPPAPPAPVVFLQPLPVPTDPGDMPGAHAAPATGAAARRSWGTWLRVAHALGAAMCWGVLGIAVYALDPAETAARTVFFGALFGALFLTLVPLFRGVLARWSKSRLYQAAVGLHATRQALLVAVYITLNGVLRVQHVWNVLTSVLLLLVLGIVEVVAFTRR